MILSGTPTRPGCTHRRVCTGQTMTMGINGQIFLKQTANLPVSNNFVIQSIYKSSDDRRNLRLIICHERCLLRNKTASVKGHTRLPQVSSSSIENVYQQQRKANGFENSQCGTLRFLKETHPIGRTRTEAIKLLSCAGTGCFRVVAISFLRHYGRARVIQSSKSHRHI